MICTKEDTALGIVARKVAKSLESTVNRDKTNRLMEVLFNLHLNSSPEEFSKTVTHHYVTDKLVTYFENDASVKLSNRTLPNGAAELPGFVSLSKDNSYEGIVLTKTHKLENALESDYNFLIEAFYDSIGNNRTQYHDKAKRISGAISRCTDLENTGMILFVSPFDNANHNLDALLKGVPGLAIVSLPFGSKKLSNSYAFLRQEYYRKQL